MNTQLVELWKAHNSTVFPAGYGGEEIEGIDLAMLDTYVGGCLTTFVSNGGHLDLWRTAILGKCYRDLTVVVNGLDGEAKGYFAQLEKLSELTLHEIILQEKPN